MPSRKVWKKVARKYRKKKFVFASRRKPSVAALRGSANPAYSGKMNVSRQYLNRLSPFPPVVIKTLTYCDQVNLASLTTTPLTGSALVYRTGSIFDPDASNVGTNHQPYYYDQLSGIYSWYQVLEFGWNIEFFNATTNTCFGAVQITQSGDSNYTIASKQLYQLRERPGGWVEPITVYGTRQAACVGNIKLWELEGLSYRQYIAEEDYQAGIGGNPTLSGNLSIAVGDLASPVAVSNVLVSVKLIYKVRLFGQIAQSTS